MRPDLAAAIAELEARAEAGEGDTVTGWRHSALVARLFQATPRVLQQLQHHAAFWKDSAPEKSAAYREAFSVITRHTGDELPLVIIRTELEHLEQADLLLI